MLDLTEMSKELNYEDINGLLLPNQHSFGRWR